MKWCFHQLAITIVFCAVGDQRSLSQQVRDRVRVAPEKLVTFGDQHLAICFWPKDDKRSETGQRDLKESPDMFRHHFERSQR
jgi:hypothetical protein